MIFEAYRKKSSEEAKEKQKSSDPSLRDILADNKNSVLFLRYIQSLPEDQGMIEGETQTQVEGETQTVNIENLTQRLLQGALEQQDFQLLARYREGFLEMQRRVEALEKELTPEFISELTLASENLARLSGLVGKDNLVNLIKDNLIYLAIDDPERFKKIEDGVNQLKSVKRTISVKENELRKMLQQRGISEKEFLEAIEQVKKGNGEDQENKMKESMKSLIRSKMNFLERGWNFLRKGKYVEGLAGNLSQVTISKEDAGMLGINVGENSDSTLILLENYKKVVDNCQKEIGDLLAGFLTENEELRLMMSKAIIPTTKPEELKRPQEASFVEVSKSMPKPEEIERLKNSSEERENAKNEMRKKGGWWKIIAGFIDRMLQPSPTP